MKTQFPIIDFHTHPYIDESTNICVHKEYCNMDVSSTVETFKKLGIEKICGSVTFNGGALKPENCTWERVRKMNDTALKLKEIYGDFYHPGFHIHPAYVKESILEVERMHKLGVNLVGELVPYMHGWADYSSKEFYEILDAVEHYDMVLNIHTIYDGSVDKLVKDRKNLTIVAAHPSEYEGFMEHLNRMKISENYYLDLSGTGIFRMGLLRHGIDEFGADRFIFGSDYPICNPACYVGGVAYNTTLTDEEKEKILYLNAKRLLKL